jgi:hypothetical protein
MPPDDGSGAPPFGGAQGDPEGGDVVDDSGDDDADDTDEDDDKGGNPFAKGSSLNGHQRELARLALRYGDRPEAVRRVLARAQTER